MNSLLSTTVSLTGSAAGATAVSTRATAINIFPLLILLITILIIAQVFILRCRNIRLGLILPFVWFVISIVLILIMIADFSKFNGVPFLSAFLMFLLLNIPTGILLLMMFIKSGKNKQKKEEIDISKIKDLE